MGACEQCIHFRAAHPPSERLARALDSGRNDADVAGALRKVQEEELQQLDQEAAAIAAFAPAPPRNQAE